MAFYTPNYRVFWSVKEYLVEIDPGDGSAPAFMNRGQILNTIGKVRRQRADYRNRIDWENALGLFQGALDALKSKMQSEPVEALR